MKLSPEEIKAISHSTPEEIEKVLTGLCTYIEKLETKIDQLETRVQDLERQLGTNSRNSSKPPSSDGFRKPKSLRKPGGKHGAPNGHKGHTLKMSATPDEVIVHEPEICTHCSYLLGEVPVHSCKKRQVLDLPVPRLIYTEHQAAAKRCPNCRHEEYGSFPQEVKAPVQYGDGVQAWTAYLNMYQHLPLERICQLFNDLTGHRPSEGTLLASLEKLSDRLEPHEQTIRVRLLDSPVVHADETGMSSDGRRNWLHLISNACWTLYHIHPKRGKEAFDDFGFLTAYKGTVVHDFWASYFNPAYKAAHALCGSHLIRECEGITEYDGHRWAAEMQTLLREALAVKKQATEAGRPVPEESAGAIEFRYDEILENGAGEWRVPPPPKNPGERGKHKKTKSANLAERFVLYKADILRFLRDGQVPFDNNQAERDVRMMKVKSKVSGPFRTEKGAIQFARIRGFISTVRKQGKNLLESLILVNQGRFSF
ncbi:IS66 family transposase [Planococcus lenghuensis]|uniref:Transposase n=1 Tax=Planococcus lenghuensis TaxID=2213202 RepID=A0A1Q2L338_9BACL|nr:IS66 family transposase [Planococcus lenghuensis]AQQ54839.1 hypothetical protein B0X71_18185 [Planococcus lenghuensis]AQQ55315.1 hypothetical protein B0X71_19260 [Planococcus lenghuensis]